MADRFKRQSPQQLSQALSGVLAGFEYQEEYLYERKALRIAIGDRYFDIAQGPDTDFGPSYEVLTSSEYRYSIGATAIGRPGEGEDNRPDIELRSPLTTLGAAIHHAVAHGMSLTRVLSSKDLYGSKAGGFFGATLMYGPSHPERAREEFASRVTIGAEPGVYTGSVLEEIQRKSQANIPGWEHLNKYYPHNDDGNILRLVKQPYTREEDNSYLSMRNDFGKDIKGRNVVYDYRENVSMWGVTKKYNYDEFGRVTGVKSQKLGPLPALPLSEVGRSDRPQWARSNVIMPGETAARPSIMLNEFIGAVPFMSGASARYPNLLAHTGAHSARQYGQQDIELPFQSIDEFRTAKFVMDKPVSGRTITAGNTATVGSLYYRRKEEEVGSLYGERAAVTKGDLFENLSALYQNQGGKLIEYNDMQYRVGKDAKSFIPEQSIFRLNITAENSDVSLRHARLIMPRSYDPETGKGFGIEAFGTSTADIMSEMAPTLRGRGMGIQRTSDGGYMMQLLTATSVGFSTKTSGSKAGDLALEGLENYPGRNAEIQGQQARIDVYNPEVKSPVARFMAAFGTMTREQQIGVLGIYDPKLANEAVGRFRSDRPMSWDELGKMSDENPYVLGSEILDRLISPNSKKKEREMIMKQFGIGTGTVTVPQFITPDLAEEYKGYVLGAAAERGMDEKDVIGKGKFINFTEIAEGSRKGSVLMEVQSRGIFMRTASQPVPEHAGGATLNYEMMRALGTRYPETAKFMGIGYDQNPFETGGMSPATRAMRDVQQVMSYSQSGLADTTATLIDPERASRLLAHINTLDPKLTDKERLKEMQNLLGNKPLRFSTLSQLGGEFGYMFSPEAAANLESEVMGKSVTGMAPLYINTITQMLQAEAMGDPEEAYYEMLEGESFTKMRNRMNRMLGGDKLGKSSKQAAYGANVKGSIGGKYASLGDLNANEVYLPDDQVRRMLMDAGVRGTEAMKKAMAQIEEKGYLPAFFIRQPLLSSEYGSPAVKIVTRDILRKRGLKTLPRPSIGTNTGDPESTNIAGFVPTNIFKQLAGDLDFDPNAIIPAARWDKGKMVFADDLDEKIAKDLSRSNPEILAEAQKALDRQFGGDFDVHKDSIDDAFEAYFDKGYPFKNLKPTYKPISGLQQEAERVMVNVMGRGTGYAARRRLESAAEALGTFSKSDIVTSMDEMTRLYQQYLDSTRGSLTNLETLYNTVGITTDQRGNYRMYGKLQAHGKWKPKLMSGARGATGLGSNLIDALSQDFLADEKPLQAGTMAFMLSSGSQDIDRIRKIIEDNSTSGHVVLSEALQDAVGDITQTPLGLSVMSAAVTRSMGKVDKDGQRRVDRMGNTKIPWRNAMHTLPDLAVDEQIMNARSLYTVFSGQRLLIPEEINRLAGIADKSEAAAFVLSQFSDWETLQAERVSGVSSEIAKRHREYVMQNKAISLEMSSLDRVARADPSKVSNLENLSFDEFALAKSSLKHIGKEFHNILYQTSEALSRGNQIESAFAALGGTKQEFGYHIGNVGRSNPLKIDGTTDNGRIVQLVGIPDFVKVEKGGITITDVKSSGRSIEDLAQDTNYQTQVRGYAQMMSTLAQNSEGKAKLREIFGAWGFEKDDIETAISHAEHGRVKGGLQVFGAEVTPEMIRQGAKGTSIDYGDMYSEAVGDKVAIAANKIIESLGGSLDLLQKFANLNRPMSFGGGLLHLNMNVGAASGIIADARRMLSENGGQERPEVNVLTHSTGRYGLGDRFREGVHRLQKGESVKNDPTSVEDVTMTVPPGTVGTVEDQVTAGTPEQQQHMKESAERFQVYFNSKPKDPVEATAQVRAAAYDIGMGMGRFSGLSEIIKMDLAAAIGIENAKDESFNVIAAKAFGASGTDDPLTQRELRTVLKRHGPELQALRQLQKRASRAVGLLDYADAEQYRPLLEEFQAGTGDTAQLSKTAEQLGPIYEMGRDLGAFKGIGKLDSAAEKVADRLGDLRDELEETTGEMKRLREDGDWSSDKSRASKVQSAKSRLAIQKYDLTKLEEELATGYAMGYSDTDLEQKRAAYMKKGLQISETERRIEDLEHPMQSAARGAGKSLRRLFGGFSLMWMGSMLGMGVEDMTRGATETDQLRSSIESVGASLGFGSDITQSLEIAKYRSSLSSGVVGRQIAMQSTQMASYTDLMGAAKTGLGTYAAMTFAGEALGGGMGASVTAAALPVAALAGIGALVYQGNAYYQNPNDTALEIYAAQKSDRDFASNWKIDSYDIGQVTNQAWRGFSSLSFMDMLRSMGGDKSVQMDFGVPVSQGEAGRMASILARDVEAWNTTGRISGMYSQTELARAYATTEFPEHDPAMVGSLRLLSQAGGLGDEPMQRWVDAAVAGVDVQNVGMARAQARGIAPSALAVSQLASNVPSDVFDWYNRQVGASIMGGFVGTSAFERLWGGYSTDQMDQAELDLAALSRSRNYGTWNTAISQANQMGSLGINNYIPSEQEALAWGTPERQANLVQSFQNNRAINMAQNVMNMTGSFGTGSIAANSALLNGPGAMKIMEGVMNFDPASIAIAGQGGASLMNPIQTRQVRQTYGADGTSLGLASLPAFTMDMGLGTWSGNQVAGMVWGSDWASDDPFGLRSAAVDGGFRGMQTAYRTQAANLSAASAGLSMRSADLSYAFQTGIGLQGYGTVNPVTGQAFNLASGGFWGLQDKQVSLQHEQQLWNFQYQQQSMDLQRSQFYDSQSLQQRGSRMNRSFTQRGWEFEDEMRDLQWGWQQEDYAEESRFMTGRQRRLAERNMNRATIMHDLQGERTEEQRSQQEQLWDLEDERFKMTREHFEEQMDLQEENFEKMQEFYEQRKKLEDQMQELQRAYFIEQNKLQKESAGLQAAQAALQREMAEEQEKMNNFLQDQQGRLELQRTTWQDIGEYLLQIAEEMADILDIELNSSGGSNPSAPNPQPLPPPPPVPPQGMTVNPWNDEIITTKTQSSTRIPTPIVLVRIGNEEIKNYIVQTVDEEL